MLQLLKLLGKLGSSLPSLSSKEWDNIFEFLDYFLIIKNEDRHGFTNIEWKKVKEILMLLDKIQD